MKIIFTIFLGIAFCTSFLLANETRSFQTGLGIVHTSKIYKGTSSKTKTLPLVIADYKDFYIKGLAIGYAMYKKRSFTSSLELSSDFLGYKNSDSIYLHTLIDKKPNINAVLKNQYTLLKDMKLIGNLHYDISNKHNSYSIELGIDYMLFQNRKHTIASSLLLEYMDKEKTDYYYGVLATQTNPYIYPYTAQEAINTTIGIQYSYRYDTNYSIISHLKTTFLDNSISDSPIVDTKYQHSFLIGVLYAW